MKGSRAGAGYLISMMNGNCIQTASGFGANILRSRNEMDRRYKWRHIWDKRKPWCQDEYYNALRQDFQRLFSNNIYDALGTMIKASRR